jgi:biotin--protein ligase
VRALGGLARKVRVQRNSCQVKRGLWCCGGILPLTERRIVNGCWESGGLYIPYSSRMVHVMNSHAASGESNNGEGCRVFVWGDVDEPQFDQIDTANDDCASSDALNRVIDCTRRVGSSASADGMGGSTFDVDRYIRWCLEMGGLQQSIGRVIVTAEKTTSTQSSLQKRAGRIPNGTVFVADAQVGGRGRGGNTWESPAGCLMFSMGVAYNGTGTTLPFVQYVVSLAVVQTCVECLQRAGGDGCNVIRIKWPNDIYYYSEDSFQKIGGILCHSSFRDGIFHMTIGIGLNVSNSKPTMCLNDVLERTREGSGGVADNKVCREEVVAGIVNRLDTMLPRLEQDGFEQFKSEYYSAWLHTGQRVQVSCEDGQMRGMTILGLTEQGYLLGMDDEGSGGGYELCPDGNSFDFLKGLVASKKISS